MSEMLTKVRGKVANLGMKTKTGLMAVAMSTACAVPLIQVLLVLALVSRLTSILTRCSLSLTSSSKL